MTRIGCVDEARPVPGRGRRATRAGSNCQMQWAVEAASGLYRTLANGRSREPLIRSRRLQRSAVAPLATKYDSFVLTSDRWPCTIAR